MYCDGKLYDIKKIKNKKNYLYISPSNMIKKME
jgi:hypothetical protein